MLDTDPDLDRKLRALYDHIKTQDPPASLALITRPPIRSDRRVLGRIAGIAGFAVIVAGIALFATELHGHRVSTPPKQSTHTVTPPVAVPSPVWSPSPLPSPNPRVALPSLPNRNLLPASVRILVPETQGTGGATVTIVPDGELFIQYACLGGSSLVVTATDVLGPERRPACSSSVAKVSVVGTASPAYPNQVLKAGEAGKPVTITISTGPSTIWEIFVAESGPPISTQGWIAVSALPWSEGIGEHGDIYLLGPGASPRRIIGSDVDGVAQDCPTFSPDGQRLAYGQARASGATNNDRGVWPVSDRAVVVVAINADGDPSQPLMRANLPTSAGEMACPEWSPDGRYIAYRVGADLWVADPTTGTTTLYPVVATPWNENAIAWSRDGSRIAVAEPGQIRIVPINGSTPTVIPAFGLPGSYDGSMGWTAGDADIVYVSEDPLYGSFGVNRVDANGNKDTHLASATDAAVSPDGTRVAYITQQPNDPHVMIMPIRGGKAVAVAVPSNFITLEGLLWSPDGKRLLLSSVDGVVSVPVAPGSAPLVYATGQSDYPGSSWRLDLEWSWMQVTWQPATRPSP